MDLDLFGHAAKAQDRIALQSRLVIGVRSKVTCSNSVQLADWRMPPSIWLSMPSGLTASPLSTAATARTRRTAPVSCSTSTSTATRT